MAQYTLTDRFSRTVEADGAGNYWLSDGSISIQAADDAAALSTLNAMAPPGYTDPVPSAPLSN